MASEAIYIRLGTEELNFINTFVREEKVTRSEAINKLIDYAAKKLKIEKAIKNYKDGKNTIRECADIAGLRYFEFFEFLAKENIIGTSSENIEYHIKQLKKY